MSETTTTANPMCPTCGELMQRDAVPVQGGGEFASLRCASCGSTMPIDWTRDEPPAPQPPADCHIDAYDAQEILRAMEVTYVNVLAELGREPAGLKRLLERWHGIMDRLGVDRYGTHAKQFEIVEVSNGK